MIVRAIVALLALSLSACAIVPESIQVPENTPLIGYSKAVVASKDVVGKSARWGGIITNVENKPEQTLIEVVYFPLNHYGKPNTGEDTPGRFKAVISQFVDPILFEKGRTVTFLGTVGQPLAGMVGEQPYMFPALNVEDYHLWRKQQVYDTSMMFFDYYTGWYSPFYHPYWRPWGMGSRIRVIRSSNEPTWSGPSDNNRSSKQGHSKTQKSRGMPEADQFKPANKGRRVPQP